MRIYVIIDYRPMNEYSCKSVHMLNDTCLKSILLAMYDISTISF